MPLLGAHPDLRQKFTADVLPWDGEPDGGAGWSWSKAEKWARSPGEPRLGFLSGTPIGPHVSCCTALGLELKRTW